MRPRQKRRQKRQRRWRSSITRWERDADISFIGYHGRYVVDIFDATTDDAVSARHDRMLTDYLIAAVDRPGAPRRWRRRFYRRMEQCVTMGRKNGRAAFEVPGWRPDLITCVMCAGVPYKQMRQIIKMITAT